MNLSVSLYNDEMENEWDEFVLNRSLNGTFIQTRKFINYHQSGKFKDCSVCVRKGKELVGTILACEIIEENGEKIFAAHQGTTYGGVTISNSIYNATAISELFIEVENFVINMGYKKMCIKMVPRLYQKKSCDLLEYFFFKNGFSEYDELNYYLDLNRYKEDILMQFSAGKRRDFRYSLKYDLMFKELVEKEEVTDYYNILLLNLKKLNLNPVHTCEDIIDLKYNRFPRQIKLYGVFYNNKIIAGSMVFLINQKAFHTQYLSSDEQYLKMFPMDFLIYNLIETAVRMEMRVLSFGICTENKGKYLNMGLSRFKEGFGTEYCVNKSYEKVLSESK